MQSSISILGEAFGNLASEIERRYKIIAHGRPNYCQLPNTLGQIIDGCYAASLRSEERRQTRLILVCADQNFAHRWGAPDCNWDVGKFDAPKPLTPATLAKLAAGLDISKSGLLVWDDGDRPGIWGVVRMAQTIPNSEPHRLLFRTLDRALRLCALSPGYLQFDDLRSVMGELKDGELTFWQSLPIIGEIGSPFTQCLTNLGNETYGDAFSSLPDYLQPHAHPHHCYEWSNIFVTVVVQVLRSMQQHERGGTLIISSDPRPAIESEGNVLTNEGTQGMATLHVRLKNYLRAIVECESSRLAPLLKSSHTNSVVHDIRYSMSKLHCTYTEVVRAARFIGNLTATDGAVILTPDLRIHSFGTKLHTPQPGAPKPHVKLVSLESIVKNTWDDTSTLEEYEKLRGSRFNSAVNAALTTDSIVFVASVDGALSALMKHSDEVLMGEPLCLEEFEPF